MWMKTSQRESGLSGLEDEDARRRILGEAVREDAPRGAATDDDDVVRAPAVACHRGLIYQRRAAATAVPATR